jgi:hypothetical protein
LIQLREELVGVQFSGEECLRRFDQSVVFHSPIVAIYCRLGY